MPETMGQVGIIREKETEKVSIIHWQSKTIGGFHYNIFEAEAYAASLTNEECVYWKTIRVEVGLRYRIDKFTALTDSKSVNVTVDAPKFNKYVMLPSRNIAVVRSLIQFEGIEFQFVPRQMIIADCLTKAMSGKDLLGVLEEGVLRQIDLTSDYSIKAVSLYAPVAYMDKELDENNDFVDLSPGEQVHWSSNQSDTEDRRGEEMSY